MSAVKRYIAVDQWGQVMTKCMDLDAEGPYCLFSDYDRLRAERDELQDELETFRLGKHHQGNAALREAAGRVVDAHDTPGEDWFADLASSISALRALLEKP
jgi:hypothetical protein